MTCVRNAALRLLVGAAGLAVATVVCIAGVASAEPPAAQKGWKRLQTQNFELLGNTGEGDLRGVAERLEQFRDAMGLLFRDAARPSANRTRVLVFRNHRTYDPFKPLYQGKPAAIGGYFLGGEDVNHITLTVENGDENLGVVYHEYVHLLMSDSIGTVPPWVSEGLAEYYSSFTTSENGRKVHIGRAHADHVLRLRQEFLPLATLVSAGRDSAHYNERDKKSVFYAESWAFVHYLLLGNSQRYAPKAASFVAALASGETLEAACREVLHIEPAQLERDLRMYVQRSLFTSQVATFGERLERLSKLPVTPLSEAEAHAVLGDLLQRLRRDDQAQAQLAVALQHDPESVTAHAALAQLRLRQGQPSEALAHLERASRHENATFLTHFQHAAALHEVASAGTAQADASSREAHALARAIALNPDFAEAYHRLAILKSSTPGGIEEALTLVEKARSLAPGREAYVLTLAYLHANAQHVAAARTLARTLVANGSEEETRARARVLLERLEAYERHAERAKAAAAAAAGPAAASDVRFDPERQAPGAVVPVFREMTAGETRVYGYLVAIECSQAGAIVLHVDAGGTALKVGAPRLDAIDFISYRTDLTGAVSCGRRPALDAVYVTYTPRTAANGTVGTVLAVEFVPRGFVPKQP